MKYTGKIMDFDYEIELEDDEQFEVWLEAKLIRYKFKPIELKILRKLLGVTELENRLVKLEGG